VCLTIYRLSTNILVLSCSSTSFDLKLLSDDRLFSWRFFILQKVLCYNNEIEKNKFKYFHSNALQDCTDRIQ